MDCIVERATDGARAAEVSKLLVDTGSECTWIPGPVLDQIGIGREKEGAFVRTLEGLNPTVDAARKRLVPGGPHPAAVGRR